MTEPNDQPEGAVRLGVSVLDDAGVIRAWEVMKAQTESTLVPTYAAQAWIDSLPLS